jgi:hypothetical protein
MLDKSSNEAFVYAIKDYSSNCSPPKKLAVEPPVFNCYLISGFLSNNDLK